MGDKKPDLALLARLSPPSPLSGKPIDRSLADPSCARQFGYRHPLTVRGGIRRFVRQAALVVHAAGVSRLG
jgi:hypothetical protein